MQHRAPTPPPPKGPPPKRTPINTTAPRTPPKGPISACNTPPGTPVFYLNEVTPPGTPVITEDTRTQATEDSFTITITDTENSDFDSDEEPLKVDLNGAPSPVSTPPGTPQGKTTRRRKSEQRKSRRSSAHPEDVRQLEEMNRTLRSELHLSGKNVAMVSVRLQSSQQRLAVVLNKLEQLEDYDTYPTQQISNIYDGPAAAGDDQLPRMTIAPTDLKETVKVTLRGLGKDVRVPLSLRMSKLAAKILQKSAEECSITAILLVVLRADQESTIEVGMFTGGKLNHRVWEAGIENGDIIHVVAPLPPNWHLLEDVESKVYYLNEVTSEVSTRAPEYTSLHQY